MTFSKHLSPQACVLALGFVAVAGMFLVASCGTDESPGAAYDEDGRLPTSTAAPQGPVRNLVILLLDTLRRDAVAWPGETGGVMPHTSALAKRGTAFANAASPSSWTIPALTSMLSGLHAHEHLCIETLRPPELARHITTYTEALAAGHGYDTRVYTGAPWFQSLGHSLLQGFGAGSAGKGFGLAGIRETLEPWVRSRRSKQPFFLLLHSFEAHDPYGEANHPYPDTMEHWQEFGFEKRIAEFDVRSLREPGQMVREFYLDRIAREALVRRRGQAFMRTIVHFNWDGLRRHPDPALAAELRKAYFDGAAWLDGLVRDTFTYLDKFGLLENTMVVVASDHGEALGEHGMLGHGRQLHDEVIRVPLLVMGPGALATPQVKQESVSLLDVMPTFFDWAGLAPIRGTHGRSLLPLMRGDAGGRPVISQDRVAPDNTTDGVQRLLYSVRNERWKFHLTYDLIEGSITERVYDLKADPGELTDLLAAGRGAEVAWGGDFCAAVDTVRGWAWDEVEVRRADPRFTDKANERVPEGDRPVGCAVMAR